MIFYCSSHEVRFTTEQDDNIYTGEITGKPANSLGNDEGKKEDNK